MSDPRPSPVSDSNATDPSEMPTETVVDGQARAAAEPESLQRGSHVGRYVILYRLGRGGMGVVYAAYDPQLDRKIAIKVMQNRGGRRDLRQSRGRMLREAQMLAKLSHPNVVAIHDVGIVDEQVFVAMDYLEGQTLRRWVKAQERSINEIVAAYVQAGDGLAAAHRADIVHRDFKPDNAIIDRDGRVFVLDFGLARARGDSGEHPVLVRRADGAVAAASSPATLDETRIGAQGTPAYMSPEQHLGERAGPASDQFSFCVSLYEALFGRLPFEGEHHTALALNVIQGRIRDPPRHTKAPARLRRLLWRGLSVGPENRYPSLDALLSDLRSHSHRRRRGWVAGMGLLFAGGAAWFYGESTQTDEPCTDGRRRLAGIWDAARREAVGQAFAASSRHHAERTLESVTRVLDDYADDWISAWTDACRATLVRHEQSDELMDLRMACMRRRSDELRALSRVLAESDDEVVDRALTAAEALPDLAPCADAVALRERSSLPDDPEARTRIEEQHTALAEAAALEHAGKLDEARAIARSVVEQARRLEHAPLLAEGLHQLGEILEAAADPDSASDALHEAAVQAEIARDDLLLARVRVLLVMVDGDRLGRSEQGRLWAELARATLTRIGGHVGLEATLENNLAFVIEADSRPEMVLERRRRALRLFEELEDGSELRRATLLANLAGTLADLHRFEEALERARAAHAIWNRILGPAHGKTAIGLSTIGLVHDLQGNAHEALKWYERAYEALERALGPDNLRSAAVLNNIAITSFRLGDSARGEATFRKVLAIRKAALGEKHPDVASAYANLAASLPGDRVGEALEYHQKALDLRRQLFDADHPSIADSLDGVANALERLGRHAEALKLRIEALEIQQKVYGHDHGQLVVPLANMAHNRIVLNDLATALAEAERGVAIAERHEVRDDVRAFARAVLAKVLTRRAEDPDRVRTLFDQALRELHDLPARTERKLLDEVARTHGWPEVSTPE